MMHHNSLYTNAFSKYKMTPGLLTVKHIKKKKIKKSNVKKKQQQCNNLWLNEVFKSNVQMRMLK